MKKKELKEGEMEFDKSRVFTALNADELKPGDKVIVANTIGHLKHYVAHCTKENCIIKGILDEEETRRFLTPGDKFSLAYLVERKENCTNCIGCELEQDKTYKCPHYISAYKAILNIGKRPESKINSLNKKPDFVSLGNGQYAERKHYRPFKDVDELVKVWCDKGGKWQKREMTMPLIWVQNKSNKKPWLINEFDKRILNYLFTNCEFLDGSPCGAEE